MIILDLDNCISDDAWRIPKIRWQQTDPMRRYHDYHLLAGFDKLANKHLLSPDLPLVIFTARPVMYRAITEEWLERNGIAIYALLMRNDNDHRSGPDVKETQLSWLLGAYNVSKSQIDMAYDDRPEIVEMYQRNGIKARQVAIHDVCALTPIHSERISNVTRQDFECRR